MIAGPRVLRVRFHAHGRPDEAIGLVATGRAASRFGCVSTHGRQDGVALIRISSRLRPGRYDLVLVDMARNHIETKAPVWVYGPHSQARLSSDRRTVPGGEPGPGSWTRAPGDNLDWIGLFRCHRTCGGPGSYLVYRYTRTAIEGTVTLRPPRLPRRGLRVVAAAARQYVARLLVDDSYHARGVSSRFRIVRRDAYPDLRGGS